MKTTARLGMLLVLGCLACAGSPETPVVSQTTGADYVAEIESHRESRVGRLQTSWLTIAGLFWLEPGENTIGSDPASAVVLPEGAAPAVAGTLTYADGKVAMFPEAGVEMTVDEAPVGGEIDLTPGESAPEVTLGRLTFWVIERSGRHAIRLKDPEFQARVDFEGIEFYPVDEAWRVEGHLAPYDEPRTMSIETVIGPAEMTSIGRVEFELDGTAHSLEALESSPEELFLIFKDGTTARGETYAAGRYHYAPIAGERVLIDFNKAYNPPCAFTPHATCPLPPRGNTLEVAIEAGERAYHLEGK